jgi:hypothetical protein
LDGRGLPRFASVILAQRSGSFAISPGKWQAWEKKKKFSSAVSTAAGSI